MRRCWWSRGWRSRSPRQLQGGDARHLFAAKREPGTHPAFFPRRRCEASRRPVGLASTGRAVLDHCSDSGVVVVGQPSGPNNVKGAPSGNRAAENRTRDRTRDIPSLAVALDLWSPIGTHRTLSDASEGGVNPTLQFSRTCGDQRGAGTTFRPVEAERRCDDSVPLCASLGLCGSNSGAHPEHRR
jgi:hypothetical protein